MKTVVGTLESYTIAESVIEHLLSQGLTRDHMTLRTAVLGDKPANEVIVGADDRPADAKPRATSQPGTPPLAVTGPGSATGASGAGLMGYGQAPAPAIPPVEGRETRDPVGDSDYPGAATERAANQVTDEIDAAELTGRPVLLVHVDDAGVPLVTRVLNDAGAVHIQIQDGHMGAATS